MHNSASRSKVFLALGMVWVAFGSTYLGIALSAKTMPPLLSTGLRFAAASLLIIVSLGIVRQLSRFLISLKQLLTASISGALVMGINIGAIALAVNTVPTSLIAISEALIPVWVIIFRIGAKELFSRQVTVGVAMGFIGVVIAIIGGKTSGTTGLTAEAIFWLVIIQISSILWAYFAWKAPRLDLPRDSLVSAVYQMLGAAIALTVVGYMAREEWDLPLINTESKFAWLYLVIVSALGYIAYTYLFTYSTASLASSFSYTSPVIASILGIFFAGEIITVITLVGLVATVIGVILITRGETKPAFREVLLDSGSRK